MAAIRALRAWILDIIQQLLSGNSDSDNGDCVLYHVDCLYNTVVRYDDVLAVDSRVVNFLREAVNTKRRPCRLQTADRANRAD